MSLRFRGALPLAGALWLAGCIVIPKPSTSTDSSPATGSPTTSPLPTASGMVVDIVLQDEVSAVDLLLVVQNTPGMADAQTAFVDNLPSLLDYFLGSGVDYHIGVISSDVSDPATAGVLVEASGRRWVDMETPNPVELLWAMSALGESATSSSPMTAVYAALELQDQANAGFYREDAALAVIVISDGTDSVEPGGLTDEEFVNWMSALKANDRPTYSCLLDGTGSSCSLIASLLGGLTGEVLDNALYGQLALEAVGLERSFPLSNEPVPGTLEVEVHDQGVIIGFEPATYDAYGNLLDGDWIYDAGAKLVTFLEYVPNQGAEVHMRYEPVIP